MSKSKDTPYYIGLGIIILIFGYFAVTNVVHYINKDKVVDSNRSEDRAPVADKFLKKFNTVPDFEFVDQNGDTITNESLKGKVYIVDFFFTSCPTICAPMSHNLKTVQDELKSHPDFKILSVSIDPDYDKQPVLKNYADRHDAIDGLWHFARGDKEATFKLAREGFSAYVGESQDSLIKFEHSGNFALVDREGKIRSRKDAYGNWMMVYNGVEENGIAPQLKEIIEDAQTLLNK
ncbi:SCO family protein [Nonlabens ulvanivorans]|uniref:Cytochrome oxidase biogenesis proteinSco1/SenC/PrrC n=1 Tax=Nonlabens ulvanivorans TaxID=906888 RepID=A0A081D6I2_NONUL|nr:SCO family protein [Nonlabens ulvanivorans]WOI22180.1 SCO family protein [Nonlabens ulvanivorans]GAK74528.1 cytochrome oxidase biogenesis proteinSco1/SenC/PrrC [Nonlabens ulvanivorans]